MDYNQMAQMKLHNIKLRRTLAEETAYTKMLDDLDFNGHLLYSDLARQAGIKMILEIDEPSFKAVEKKIDGLTKCFSLGR